MRYPAGQFSNTLFLILLACGAGGSCFYTFVAYAGDIESQDRASIYQQQGKEYSRKGADTCLKCHDEDYRYPVLPIFFSKHGNRHDSRTPMAQLQCESCHGPGRAHAREPNVGFQRAPIISFGRKAWPGQEQQNAQCLQCHEGGKRMRWVGSVHDKQQLLCVDCHKMHARVDPVLSSRNQAERCYVCHKKQRAEFARASVHPVRYGKMLCSDCHNPHGSFSASLLKTDTKNNTCYRCHAEKRGPFLWAHAPVQEDCTLCHEQHGSINAPLLKKRPPLLCQQCHSMAGHPSFALTGSDLSSAANSAYLLGKSCLNCHFQVHGSNHPSGVKLMR